MTKYYHEVAGENPCMGDTVTIRVSVGGGKSWDHQVLSPLSTKTMPEIKQNLGVH